jgi:hypothetical protein
MTQVARLLLAAALGGALCAGSVCAQDKAKGKPAAGRSAKAAAQPKTAPQPKAAQPKRGKSKRAEEPARAARALAHAPEAAHAPPPMAADDEGDVRKEGATEIKTLEFTGLDIEGQLKTPQMLYFLNRLRAEFARPELPHRSFIPELSRSSKEKEL